MLPFEKVPKYASILAVWLEKQIEDFQMTERFRQEHDSGRSERDTMTVSKLWLPNVLLNPREKKTGEPNLSMKGEMPSRSSDLLLSTSQSRTCDYSWICAILEVENESKKGTRHLKIFAIRAAWAMRSLNGPLL